MDLDVLRAARVQLLDTAPDKGEFWQPALDELELVGARGRVCQAPPRHDGPADVGASSSLQS